MKEMEEGFWMEDLMSLWVLFPFLRPRGVGLLALSLRHLFFDLFIKPSIEAKCFIRVCSISVKFWYNIPFFCMFSRTIALLPSPVVERLYDTFSNNLVVHMILNIKKKKSFSEYLFQSNSKFMDKIFRLSNFKW